MGRSPARVEHLVGRSVVALVHRELLSAQRPGCVSAHWQGWWQTQGMVPGVDGLDEAHRQLGLNPRLAQRLEKDPDRLGIRGAPAVPLPLAPDLEPRQTARISPGGAFGPDNRSELPTGGDLVKRLHRGVLFPQLQILRAKVAHTGLSGSL